MPVYIAKEFAVPQTIAVLPMENGSNDLDAPAYLRQLLFDRLSRRGFHLIPLADIDAKLKDAGFTDGGQLRGVDPKKIGEWVGADGLFYSTIDEFKYINVGFYAQRLVKIQARLVRATTGEKLWETERHGTTRLVATKKEEAKKLFASQLALQAIEKASHTPLRLESTIAVDALIATLP